MGLAHSEVRKPVKISRVSDVESRRGEVTEAQ